MAPYTQWLLGAVLPVLPPSLLGWLLGSNVWDRQPLRVRSADLQRERMRAMHQGLDLLFRVGLRLGSLCTVAYTFYGPAADVGFFWRNCMTSPPCLHLPPLQGSQLPVVYLCMLLLM
jgi:hypothetical protein